MFTIWNFIISILPLNIYLDVVTQVLFFKSSYKILPRLRVPSLEDPKYFLYIESVGNFSPFKKLPWKWIDLIIRLKGHFHLLLTSNLSPSLRSLSMAINRHSYKSIHSYHKKQIQTTFSVLSNFIFAVCCLNIDFFFEHRFY